MKKGLVWVKIPGGVMGFEPSEINKFNQEYKKIEKYGLDYWGYFNWYFQDELDGRIAKGFSASWNDQRS